MNILIANFAKPSLKLIAWASAQKLQAVRVISVDTGFADPTWQAHVNEGKILVESLGFMWIRLIAKPDFIALVRAQGEFPSKKFQWCATYLKGETIRQYLEAVDPLREAKIFLASAHFTKEKEGSEDFGDRLIVYPFYNQSEDRTQRSLECNPCVNDLVPHSNPRLEALEMELGQKFFDPERQQQGCGSFYGCGT